jgi:hypothetical protein
VCLFAALAIYQVARLSPNTGEFPKVSQATALARFATQYRVSYGYASFWDAAGLTWFSHFRVKLFPAHPCPHRRGECMYPLGRIDTWYRPRPHSRSLLVVDRHFPAPKGPNPPDRALGRPIAVRAIGRLRAYVYPFDLAGK